MSVKTGGTVHRIGDTVASIIAPGERYGRVVGIMKWRRRRRLLVREYTETDGGRWPSGKYQYKADDEITPWSDGGDA